MSFTYESLYYELELKEGAKWDEAFVVELLFYLIEFVSRSEIVIFHQARGIDMNKRTVTVHFCSLP